MAAGTALSAMAPPAKMSARCRRVLEPGATAVATAGAAAFVGSLGVTAHRPQNEVILQVAEAAVAELVQRGQGVVLGELELLHLLDHALQLVFGGS